METKDLWEIVKKILIKWRDRMWPWNKFKEYRCIIAMARKVIDKRNLENAKLEEEAQWLAERLADFCQNNGESCCCLNIYGCDKATPEQWRKAARKEL